MSLGLLVQCRRDTVAMVISRNSTSFNYVILQVLFGLIVGSWTLGNTGEYFEAIGAGKGAARGIFPVLNRFMPIKIQLPFALLE